MSLKSGAKLSIVVIEKNRSYFLDLLSKVEAFWPNQFDVRYYEDIEQSFEYLMQKKIKLMFIDVEVENNILIPKIERLINKPLQVVFTGQKKKLPAIPPAIQKNIYCLNKPILIQELKDLIDNDIQIVNSSYTSNNPYLDKCKNRLVLTSQGNIKFVKINDIILCRSYNNYTTFHLLSDERIVIAKPLKYFENILEKLAFFRAHQSYLVNLEHVRELVRKDGGYLILSNDLTAIIARNKRERLIEMLKHPYVN